MAIEKLVTVRQLAERCPALTEAALRWHLFKDTGGFRSRCARRIGTRILLDLDSVEIWLAEQGGPRAAVR